ncbi:MAG: beta-propeller domain-containing protein [Pseudomonadota bacterium]
MQRRVVKAWGYFSTVLVLCSGLVACLGGDQTGSTPVAPKALKKSASAGEFEAYIKRGFTRLSQADNSSGAYTGLVKVATGGVDRTLSPVGAPAADATLAGGGAASAPISTTNRVDSGVDETDTVKSDGDYLYVLEARPQIYYMTALPVVSAGTAQSVSPAIAAPAITRPSSILPPGPLPVPEPQKIRILKRDTQKPGVIPLAEISIDVQVTNVAGFYLMDRTPQTPGADTLLVVGNGNNAVLNDAYYIYHPTSIVTAYDLSDPAQPKKQWDFSVEGYLNTSRSAHNRVYLVTQFSMWPQNFLLGATAPADVEKNKTLINSLTIENLLPKATINNVAQPIVTAQDCLVPTTVSNGNIFTGSLMTLIALPIDDPTQTASLCTTESTSTVYSSVHALYAIANEYLYINDAAQNRYETNTVIHKFDYTDTGFAYQASGRVTGWMGWVSSAFRLHEHNGYFRIFTSSGWGADRTHQLHVLAPATQTPGELVEIAGLPNKAHPEPIGKPGEDIHGVRFNGDHAYVVTFLNTDPLYAINLVAPDNPYIEGALELPGYSDYLHPIGENYLLGVGKDAIVENGVAYYQGVKVGLFDVTDKARPVKLGEVAIGKRGSDALVTADYKSFAIVHDVEQDKYRVMLPVRMHGEDYTLDPKNPPSAATYYQWSYSGAHLLEIGSASATTPRLTQTGILKSAVFSATQTYDYNYDARALIIGDQVHYVQQGKVWSATWAAPQKVLGPQ